MRGPENSKIKLKIVSRGHEKPNEVSIPRARIQVRSGRSHLEGDDVGFIRVTQFNEQTTEGLKKAITDLSAQAGDKLKGFIIDLRNNPGGLLDQAISVSDAFLEKGEIVSTRGRNAEETQRFNARAGDLTKSKPIIVLINSGSASASEIVTCAPPALRPSPRTQKDWACPAESQVRGAELARRDPTSSPGRPAAAPMLSWPIPSLRAATAAICAAARRAPCRKDGAESMPRFKSLPYRPCVGIAVFNRKARVFIGRRLHGPAHVDDTHAWQLPQGGIDRGEDPWPAALRELYEGTNIRSVEKLGEIEEELGHA